MSNSVSNDRCRGKKDEWWKRVSCCVTTEREGFEPSKAVRPHRFSRPAPSTTRTPLLATHNRGMGNLFPGLSCRTFWLRSSVGSTGPGHSILEPDASARLVARRALGFGMSILKYRDQFPTRVLGRSRRPASDELLQVAASSTKRLSACHIWAAPLDTAGPPTARAGRPGRSCRFLVDLMASSP